MLSTTQNIKKATTEYIMLQPTNYTASRAEGKPIRTTRKKTKLVGQVQLHFSLPTSSVPSEVCWRGRGGGRVVMDS